MCDYGRLYIFDGIMFVERFAGFWASRAERRIRRCYPGGAGRPGIGVAQSSANQPPEPGWDWLKLLTVVGALLVGVGAVIAASGTLLNALAAVSAEVRHWIEFFITHKEFFLRIIRLIFASWLSWLVFVEIQRRRRRFIPFTAKLA